MSVEHRVKLLSREKEDIDLPLVRKEVKLDSIRSAPDPSKGKAVIYAVDKAKRAMDKAKETHLRQRIQCNCQARGGEQEHGLFSNCTVCGYVLCQREGEGPCFFCGSFVTKLRTDRNSDYRVIYDGKYQPDVPDATSTLAEVELKNAVAFKDRLITFAQEKAKRTHIIDDQADFYDLFGAAEDVWLEKEELAHRRARALMEKESFENNRSTITLSFEETGLQFVDSKSSAAEKLSAFSYSNLSVNDSCDGYYKNNSLRGSAAEIYVALVELRRNNEKKKEKPLEALPSYQTSSAKHGTSYRNVSESAFKDPLLVHVEDKRSTKDSIVIYEKSFPENKVRRKQEYPKEYDSFW